MKTGIYTGFTPTCNGNHHATHATCRHALNSGLHTNTLEDSIRKGNARLRGSCQKRTKKRIRAKVWSHCPKCLEALRKWSQTGWTPLGEAHKSCAHPPVSKMSGAQKAPGASAVHSAPSSLKVYRLRTRCRCRRRLTGPVFMLRGRVHPISVTAVV